MPAPKQKTIDSCCSKCFSLCAPLSSDRPPGWGWEQHGAPRCLCCSAMCFMLKGVGCAFLTGFECHAEPQGNPQRSGRREQAGKVAHAHQDEASLPRVSLQRCPNQRESQNCRCWKGSPKMWQCYGSTPSAHSIHPLSEMHLKAFYFPPTELA